MTGAIDSRLAELGIELPEAPAPAANYVPWVVTGNLVFIAGQVPFKDGKLSHIGKLGDAFTVEDGQACARIVAINILAQLKAACGGDLDRVTRCVKLGGFVNSTPGLHRPAQGRQRRQQSDRRRLRRPRQTRPLRRQRPLAAVRRRGGDRCGVRGGMNIGGYCLCEVNARRTPIRIIQSAGPPVISTARRTLNRHFDRSPGFDPGRSRKIYPMLCAAPCAVLRRWRSAVQISPLRACRRSGRNDEWGRTGRRAVPRGHPRRRLDRLKRLSPLFPDRSS